MVRVDRELELLLFESFKDNLVFLEGFFVNNFFLGWWQWIHRLLLVLLCYFEMKICFFHKYFVWMFWYLKLLLANSWNVNKYLQKTTENPENTVAEDNLGWFCVNFNILKFCWKILEMWTNIAKNNWKTWEYCGWGQRWMISCH